jgi:hypothetical protein
MNEFSYAAPGDLIPRASDLRRSDAQTLKSAPAASDPPWWLRVSSHLKESPAMKKLVTALALALVALAAAATGSTSIGRVGSPGAVRPWSVQYMYPGERVSRDQAVEIANTFDLIAAVPHTFDSYVSAMKAANPKLQLYVYAKGMFTYDQTLPESAYAHDALGSRIHALHYKTWLLDPLSPQAVAAAVANAKQQLAESGYDGIFLDTLGPVALDPSFSSGVAVNPTTGRAWTPEDWMRATSVFAGRLETVLGKPVMGNGLHNGPSYFNPHVATSQLLDTGLMGGMAESWLRPAHAPASQYPSEEQWKQNVDAIADAGARGSSFCAVTKLWMRATPAQQDAWFMFAAASFLLGNDGSGYFTYTTSRFDTTEDYPLYHVDLGAAKGPYAKVSNVYQRAFDHGRVLVNPSPSSTYTVVLGGTYQTLDGHSINAVTLPPHTAQIVTS